MLGVSHPVVHPGRYYQSPLPNTFLTDAKSTSGSSGSPVLTANGHVIGMLRGEWNEVNALVVSIEGLLMSLKEIGGGRVDWKGWGVKACLGYHPHTPVPQPIPFVSAAGAKPLKIFCEGRDINKWKYMLEGIKKAEECDRHYKEKWGNR
ncbi:hypothetical protein AA313_de0203302 [Arthrobotrys entomopaga]|nr:hypothetical protein AA313_de0203302 [Arthrobotrys entomopaga]